MASNSKDTIHRLQESVAHLDVEVLDIVAVLQLRCTRCGTVHNLELGTGYVRCGCGRQILWATGLFTTEPMEAL